CTDLLARKYQSLLRGHRCLVYFVVGFPSVQLYATFFRTILRIFSYHACIELMMAANNWRWKHLKTYQLTHALQIRNWFKIRSKSIQLLAY
uniref:Uncharacterized protein n=1 Tax=Aegilops tauschii subsp. strangulata TaxID=200361 RepID=A0A453HQG2_AEGTS